MNLRATHTAALDMADVERIVHGRHGDPFSVLGLHRDDTGPLVRVFLPDALAVTVYDRATGAPLGTLGQVDTAGLYAGRITAAVPYVLKIDYPGGARWETEDPYSFGPLLSEEALARFADGDELDPAASLGAHVTTVEGVDGTRFALWAPNASRVAVVGDFNAWDPRRHPMRLRHRAGIWELFVPRLGPGDRYKYQIIAANGDVLPLKADPYARRSETPPATASIIADPAPFTWSDREWMEGRAARQAPEAPMAIYEVHPGSWLHGDHGQALDWDGLAARLLPYVREMGFTHVEFMPITEYPFGGSWGYQPLGLYAPTARFGTPAGFARLVDNFHAAGIGVILDWVPGHFPNDPHGLAWFDGSALYEHADPREGFHPDWNSCVYNLGRNEVVSFLLGSALYWLETFHIDGLRVDAVASMLYRDYSRAAGAWIPNIYGGRENLEAIAFLRRLNWTVQARCPGAVTIAEESTAWPGVTKPVEQDGLGFSFKWNMGWMHDTLRYMAREPIYRRYHHDDMTFGLLYAFSERFVLPLSHDEVVHGKGSLLAKMPGDRWQQLASLRAYLAFMWAHPGKKVLFMGSEIAQQAEWNHDAELEWYRLDDPGHRGVQRLVRDLNRLYAAEPALYARDCEDSSFQWLVQDDRDNSIFAFLRHGDEGTPPVMAVVNMTPMPRHGYRIGLPAGGWWTECLNSDAAIYGGGNIGNGGGVGTEAVPSHGFGLSAVVTVPPLATLLFRLENEA